ncbi:MAG: metal ABC transporter ATP-binding protein [Gaiellales bacterium]
MSATPVVQARAAAVGYDGEPVVEGVDLELPPGTTLALVGTNGSGKSTLLRSLAGLLPLVGGELAVLGGRPGTSPAEVGYLGQFRPHGLLLPIRSEDVVRMGRFAGKGLLGRIGPEDHAAVSTALARMSVSDLAHRPLRDLSGGQQQRVAIAQTLARQARLLLLDEPAAGLDATSRELLNVAIAEERRRGASVIVATHDIGDAMRCDLVLLLARRVVALGPPATVLTRATLLDTFGLAIQTLEDGVMVMETAHGHGDADPHVHDAGPSV